MSNYLIRNGIDCVVLPAVSIDNSEDFKLLNPDYIDDKEVYNELKQITTSEAKIFIKKYTDKRNDSINRH